MIAYVFNIVVHCIASVLTFRCD